MEGPEKDHGAKSSFSPKIESDCDSGYSTDLKCTGNRGEEYSFHLEIEGSYMEGLPLTLALITGEDFNRQRWGSVRRHERGSAGHKSGTLRVWYVGQKGTIDQAGFRKKTPVE